MFDYTEILLSPTFTGQTDTAETALKFRAGYWVYTSEFGGNLVDELTVRDFLDNPSQEKLATDFFNYLKENFSKEEFNELYYNNIRLAAVLNDYYNKTIRQNVVPTKTVGLSQLTATTAVTYIENYFIGASSLIDKNTDSVASSDSGPVKVNGISIGNLNVGLSNVGGLIVGESSGLLRAASVSSSDSNRLNISGQVNVGNRSKNEVTVLVSINTGNSYYINFPIHKTYNILEDANYTLYRKDTVEGSTIKKVTEWFRYALRKNSTQINPNGNVIKDYSFSNFSPSTALLPNQSQLRIQFKSDRAILDINNRVINIPIEIVYDRPATVVNQFFVVEFGYANVSAGIDFAFIEGDDSSLLSQSINIIAGSNSAIVNFIIKNDALFNMANCEITVVLKDQGTMNKKLLASQQYSVSRDTFRILSNQDNEITVLDNTSVDKIVTLNDKIVPQILLQSFVDPNYNDNESEIWQNPPTNNTLISDGDSGFGTNVSLPLTDLTLYQVYNVLINLGYELKNRSGNGGVIVTMNGNTDKVRSKLNEVFPDLINIAKRTSYGILGYNLLVVDLSNSYESGQILSKLIEFWNPYIITE